MWVGSPEFDEVELSVDGVFSSGSVGHGEDFVFVDAMMFGWSINGLFLLPVDDDDAAVGVEVCEAVGEEGCWVVDFVEEGDEEDDVCGPDSEVGALMEDEVGSVACSSV